jgi:hypothetical protein
MAEIEKLLKNLRRTKMSRMCFTICVTTTNNRQPMKKVKNIALVAHDNRKADLIEWAEWNWET